MIQTCGLCGEPMPPGEEMFNYHGYSGPCPKPPLSRPATTDLRAAVVAEIMKLVQPDRIKLDPRPGIAELEKLRDDENADLRVEPNGDVTIRDLKPRTVHDVANAVMGIIEPERERLRGTLQFIVDRENLMFAECSDAEEIIARARSALGLPETTVKPCPTCGGIPGWVPGCTCPKV